MRLMVQTLLAERFQLRVHLETKQLPGYSLVVAKNGPRLKESVRDDCPSPAGTCGGVYNFGGGISPREVGERASMAQLAQELSTVLGRTVQDNTGLAGLYDFTLAWRPDENQPGVGGGRVPYAGDANAPSLFEAVQDQLRLKLEANRVPVEILVIDHVEMPSEN